MKIRVETDRSLVDSPILYIQVGRREFYAWFDGYRPRILHTRTPKGGEK